MTTYIKNNILKNIPLILLLIKDLHLFTTIESKIFSRYINFVCTYKSVPYT